MSPFPRPDYAPLSRYTPDRRPVELDLSDNTNKWGTHPAALARIRDATSDDLRYYPDLYAEELLDAVARHFDIDVACVTTGAGSDDVLDSAFRVVYGPGATVRYAAPTFTMVEPLARMNGLDPRPVAWADALAEPELLFADAPDLVYVCRPNNPTGEHAPGPWMERVLELAGEDGPLVVFDEAYADFAGESYLALAAERPRLLVARTTSKAYGLAGLRCGFAVGTPETVLEIEKSRGPFKVSRLATGAAAAVLDDDSGWLEEMVAACVSCRERLSAALSDRGLRPFDSRANFVLAAAPSGNARQDALALREHGIAVRPFTGIPGHGESLRVTVGPWEMMERFLDALDSVMRDTEQA